MTLSESDREQLIKYNLQKCDAVIAEITFYITHDKLFVAVNRIYYCLFYALSALALQHGFATGKHLQLIGWFNKKFIHDGNTDAKYGKIIRNIFEQRSKADYDVLADFTREEVLALYDDLQSAVCEIKKLLGA